MTPIRIAHFLPWPTVGGTEVATLRAAQATEGDRFQNRMFCLESAPAVAAYFADAGFEVASFRPCQPSYRHFGAYWRASRRLAAQLRAHRTQIVHCADVLAALQMGLAARLAGAASLCHVRRQGGNMPTRLRPFLRAVNRFAFVSAAARRDFATLVPDRKATILYDGFAPPPMDPLEASAARAEFGISPEDPVIGMVALIAPVKDHATLVRAAERLRARRPRIKVLVVGGADGVPAWGALREELARMVAVRGLGNNFIFTGYRNDALRLIAAMDVLVHSSHREGLPLAIMEAMALGKPVVATAVGGIPEIVADQTTGFLVPHEDDARLAERVEVLLDDPALQHRMGLAGRERVERQFSPQSFQSSLEQLYADLLGAVPEPARALES